MNKYIIVDSHTTIVRHFDTEQEARTMLWKLRKERYIAEHPDRPAWEYDTMKHDNGFNLYKVKLVA